jgi:hypothetical protein
LEKKEVKIRHYCLQRTAFIHHSCCKVNAGNDAIYIDASSLLSSIIDGGSGIDSVYIGAGAPISLSDVLGSMSRVELIDFSAPGVSADLSAFNHAAATSLLGASGPGLNLEVPFIDRVAGRVHQRVQQLDIKIETKPDDGLAETRALTRGPAGPTRSESTARGPAAVGLFPGLIDWGHRCGAATWNRDLSRSARRVSCGVSGGPWPRIDSRLITTAWRPERGEVA